MCAIWSADALKPLQERLYSFEFPESPGALLKFLHTLGTHWNISLFHYRSHGTDYGRVLAAFELGDHEPDFETRLHELGYECHDESNNPAFRFFLAGRNSDDRKKCLLPVICIDGASGSGIIN